MAFKFIFFLALVSIVNCEQCKRVRMSCEQRRQFVDGHNLRRQEAAFGFVPNQPAASKMNYLVWDEELAEKAAKWAENCSFSHNTDRTVLSERWELVGENIYRSSIFSPFGPVMPNIDEALNTWYSEWMHYRFEPYSADIGSYAGHYTQMMWADTTKIGCGISQKRDRSGFITTYFVCNYGPTGNWIGKTPYERQSCRGYLQCPEEGCTKPYGPDC